MVLSNGRKYRVGCPHFLFSSKQIDCSKVIRQQSCHWFEWENLKRSFSLKTDSALPIANEADVISIWNLIIVPLIPPPISYPIFSIFSGFTAPMQIYLQAKYFPLIFFRFRIPKLESLFRTTRNLTSFSVSAHIVYKTATHCRDIERSEVCFNS